MRQIGSVLIVSIAISFAATLQFTAEARGASEETTIETLKTLAPSVFSLSDYREFKARDPQMAQLILQAMREAVFYAQASVGKPVLCASPMPIPGERLMEMFDQEIATPSNPDKRAYIDIDHVAFILMHALRRHGACK